MTRANTWELSPLLSAPRTANKRNGAGLLWRCPGCWTILVWRRRSALMWAITRLLNPSICLNLQRRGVKQLSRQLPTFSSAIHDYQSARKSWLVRHFLFAGAFPVEYGRDNVLLIWFSLPLHRAVIYDPLEKNKCIVFVAGGWQRTLIRAV